MVENGAQHQSITTQGSAGRLGNGGALLGDLEGGAGAGDVHILHHRARADGDGGGDGGGSGGCRHNACQHSGGRAQVAVAGGDGHAVAGPLATFLTTAVVPGAATSKRRVLVCGQDGGQRGGGVRQRGEGESSSHLGMGMRKAGNALSAAAFLHKPQAESKPTTSPRHCHTAPLPSLPLTFCTSVRWAVRR